MGETWRCSCGAENAGKFCTACGMRRAETWRCPCGAENTGKFCTACGMRRETKWSGLFLSHSHMSMDSSYSFTLQEDADGQMRLYGECWKNGWHAAVSKPNSIVIDSAAADQLRSMALDALPVRIRGQKPVPPAHQPSDQSSFCLVLTYPNGTRYEKKVPGDLRGRIAEMLSETIVKASSESRNPAEPNEADAALYGFFQMLRR